MTYRFVGIVASDNVDAFVLFLYVWHWNNWTIQLKPILHLISVCLINPVQLTSVSISLFSEQRCTLTHCSLWFVIKCHMSWCDGALCCLSLGFLSCPDVDGLTEVTEALWKSWNRPLASVARHKNCTTLSFYYFYTIHTFRLIKPFQIFSTDLGLDLQ